MTGKYVALWSLLKNERRRPAELAAMQEAKLRRLVRHAFEQVPFYRRLYKEHRVSPEDIRTAEDLAMLPVIDKEMLTAQPLCDLISDRHGSSDELIRLSTSGSSGIPFDLFIDKPYEQLRKAQALRPYLSNGRRLADRVVYVTGYPDKKPKWFMHLGVLEEKRIACDLPHARQVELCNALRPQVLQGYPSALTSLASYVRDEDLEIVRPRLIFTDSELLTSESRNLIERTFGAPLIDVFGTWETGNIAYECDRHQGYHFAIDCVRLELIKQDGKPAGEHEVGEIVCTALDNFAMPLIRYNLHDVAAFATGPCVCGRNFPVLDTVGGRSDDMVRLADGRTLSPQGFLTSFNFLSDAVKEFQVVQEATDRFRITVVPAACFDEAASERIRRSVSSRYPGSEVSIAVVDRIEREASGKLRSFVSHVPG